MKSLLPMAQCINCVFERSRGKATRMSTSRAVDVPSSLREAVRDATRYWEPRRIVYNAVLAAVVVAWILLTWPHFRPALTVQSLGPLFALAALANVCYCAAYLVDIPVQFSPIRAMWRGGRLVMWVAGTIFATLLACYWIADEIYPYVG